MNKQSYLSDDSDTRCRCLATRSHARGSDHKRRRQRLQGTEKSLDHSTLRSCPCCRRSSRFRGYCHCAGQAPGIVAMPCRRRWLWVRRKQKHNESNEGTCPGTQVGGAFDATTTTTAQGFMQWKPAVNTPCPHEGSLKLVTVKGEVTVSAEHSF